MIRLSSLAALLLLIIPPVHAQQRYTGQTIEQILALPEDQIDLGIACLVLAKDAYPDLNISGFDYLLDYMADRIRMLNQGVTDSEVRIGLMNTFLYRPGWWNDSLTFDYDLEDLAANEKKNQYLNGYLATRRGSCITMPMLHLVLADRLGWPMRAVITPKHYFVRYLDARLKIANIEATSYGGAMPDQHYIEAADIPARSIKSGAYMRTLSKKEYIASLLINNARHYHEREKNIGKAINYLNLALSVDSTLVSAHWNIHLMYEQLADQLDGELQANLELARQYFENARQRVSSLPVAGPSPAISAIQSPDLFDAFTIPGMPEGLSGFGKANPDRASRPRSLYPSVPALSSPMPGAATGSPTAQASLQLDQEYQAEQHRLYELYVPNIQELLARVDWHHRKAKELGIVLITTTKLYERHDAYIEKKRQAGKP
jgi:regulator of sirC expression with transglutaminase-like and TPR domain